MITFAQLKKSHPLFFKNCKGSDFHDIFFVTGLLDSGCFITKEIEWYDDPEVTDYRVWHYSENKDTIMFQARFKDLGCATEFATNFEESTNG